MHLMALCGTAIEFQGVAAITIQRDLLGRERGLSADDATEHVYLGGLLASKKRIMILH